jgi:tetratricopeptide (TPR) repeat protein
VTAARTTLAALALATLAVVGLAGCASGSDLEAVRLYDQANRRLLEAKNPEEFVQAAALFDQVLQRGGENGAVLHGLGNAWLQAGHKGAAIAAYRRALAYRPRDPYLRANLAQALGHEPDSKEGSLLRMLLFWQSDLSYGEKAWLLTGSVALACFVFALARVAPRTRGVARPLCGGLVVVALLAAISFAVEVHDRELTSHGAVDAPELVARKGNAESFEPAFNEPLKDGTELLVLEQRGDWLRVRVGQSLEGWVPADRVARW